MPAPRVVMGLLTGLLALGAWAGASAEPGAADAVLAALGAADRARVTLADEQSRWVLERERQRALAEALEAEARRAEAHAADLDAGAAALASDEARATLDAQIADREAEANRRATAITAALAALDARWAAPKPAPGLEGALALLSAAEEAAESVEIAVQTAVDPAADTEAAVQTLRLGLAAMWWRSLDGAEAGVVTFADGRRQLRRVAPAERAAIDDAFAIAGGQQAPRLVELPVE